MGNEQLRCLIVGETPAAQLMGWRLSLGSSFIILVSNFVSGDGLVAWKSSKLGANFYTPNIFARSVQDLAPKLLNEKGICKYPLDILLISGISIEILRENSELLSKFVNQNTTVLISADFGCELEKIALKTMGERCKCVLSIACDAECRQLSLGSYALVNDDNCEIYLGNTYSLSSCAQDSVFYRNVEKVQQELNDDNESSISRMVRQLEATQWIKVVRLKETKDMALKMWQLIIPKISLNILSIIYEQFDYEKMLENKSTEVIFRGLVQELLDICSAQCNSKVDAFLKKSPLNDEFDIDYTKIIDHCKRKRNQLITTTANEYPEYLFLPFELYCFYHRFEYPAQVLLYQPILLAEEYHVACSNLNFLYGFYSRLLSLSGLSINGGRLEQEVSQLTQHVDGSQNDSSIKKCKCKGKVNVKDGNAKGKSGIRITTSKARFGRGIFSIASPAGADYTMPRISGKPAFECCETSSSAKAMSCDSTLPSEDDDAQFADSDADTESKNDGKRACCHCEIFDPMKTSKRSSMLHSHDNFANDYNGSTESFRNTSVIAPKNALGDLSSLPVPHFSKKYSTKSLTSLAKGSPLGISSRPHSTSSLEMQLRSGRQLANDYQDLYGQLLERKGGPVDQNTYNDRRRQYIPLEKQLWHLQRRYNIMNGTITSPRLGPYSDLLTHMEVLCGDNSKDIIRFTTSRYGDLDLYTSIERDKDRIITLFDKKSRVHDNRAENDRSRISYSDNTSE